ncbi:hypothetical protein RDG66_12145 [Vibrio cholerae]|uniref:hypothetical protein n=1 Tax=Vibrio cholerae TaxID=666 RepID=UPI00115A3A18|nr:hypothetical protein [Vibrio cholerae]EJL6524634.1 hypothetical protein [Vibrio cholerae]ELH4197504.1 hypothetical protein [Vibrio cholerae]EMC8146622.1 hypothetical protein [Vibrio cholerae]MCX9559854.1 hypothetical protein [Vibrio cholerae]MCX9561081.1 hypothetical protein [Vibrio cholerae]
MNIALPAFFLLCLLLPGYIFTNAYERKENTTLEKKPFEASSASAIVIALFLQLLYASFVHHVWYPINFVICLKILTGVRLTNEDISALVPHIGRIGSYFAVLYILSHILGKILQQLMFYFNPYKSSMFAFDTPWYYELKGSLSPDNDAQIIKISALQDTNEGTFLYYGYLDDFYLDKNGQLDRLVLFDVYRRDVKKDDDGCDGDEHERYYRIKGDRLILKYDNIHNLNIEYLYIYEGDPEPFETHTEESEEN